MKLRKLRLALEALEDRTLLATCTVNKLWDSGKGGLSLDPEQVAGDLRFCIQHANTIPGPDVIDFDVTGTINLRKPLPDLVTDIDIQGPGSHLLTVRRDTGGDYRIFTVSAGVVTIRGLSVTNGKSDVGGGIYTQADLALEEVSVTSNTSTAGQGGGIYNAGILAMTLSTISANTSKGPNVGYGGGIYNTQFGQTTINASNVTGNVATGSTGPSSAYGGGIYNHGVLTIDNGAVSENQAAIRCTSSSCVIGFEAAGGGIYNNDGILAISGVSISGNLAEAKQTTGSVNGPVRGFGGGIFNSGVGQAIIGSSTITDNTARGETRISTVATGTGGGIYNAGIIDINETTISANLADGKTGYGDAYAWGGGIRNTGTLTVHRSTLAGNEAMACVYDGGSSFSYGGAIGHTGGAATIINSTIFSNRSTALNSYHDPHARGGGVYGSATLTIDHSTIAQNTAISDNAADQEGGGISSNHVTMRNSIIAGNVSGIFGPDLDGTLVSSGYNLFGNTGGGSGYAPTDLLNVNPLLGPFQDNGGRTLTLALLPGSPAIDAGNNTDAAEFDQRGPGFPRIVNGTIDIGAFEVQATGAPSLPDILAFLITADADTEWRD